MRDAVRKTAIIVLPVTAAFLTHLYYQKKIETIANTFVERGVDICQEAWKMGFQEGQEYQEKFERMSRLNKNNPAE